MTIIASNAATYVVNIQGRGKKQPKLNITAIPMTQQLIYLHGLLLNPTGFLESYFRKTTHIIVTRAFLNRALYKKTKERKSVFPAEFQTSPGTPFDGTVY